MILAHEVLIVTAAESTVATKSCIGCHSDAADNHGPFVGKGVDFVSWALKAVEGDLNTKHNVTQN